MSKSQKLLSGLLFGIVFMVLGVTIWSFFNPYAAVAYIPLLFISIYYLLWYLFTKLTSFFDTRWGHYIVLVAVILPLVALLVQKESIIRFSIQVLNAIQ